ncbi:MAG TPA: hypothetical protein VKR06_01265 [Ktedonosporobacter sp.]|nr:hypothetical protein [Ktedonosporobacter sp.]
MSPQKVSNKQIRDIQRAVHLIAALTLLIYIYTPLGGVSLFTTLLQFVLFPLVAITGILMWQWTRLRRLLNAPWVNLPMSWRRRVVE